MHCPIPRSLDLCLQPPNHKSLALSSVGQQSKFRRPGEREALHWLSFFSSLLIAFLNFHFSRIRPVHLWISVYHPSTIITPIPSRFLRRNAIKIFAVSYTEPATRSRDRHLICSLCNALLSPSSLSFLNLSPSPNQKSRPIPAHCRVPLQNPAQSSFILRALPVLTTINFLPPARS
jgi:hypothetical protein